MDSKEQISSWGHFSQSKYLGLANLLLLHLGGSVSSEFSCIGWPSNSVNILRISFDELRWRKTVAPHLFAWQTSSVLFSVTSWNFGGLHCHSSSSRGIDHIISSLIIKPSQQLLLSLPWSYAAGHMFHHGIFSQKLSIVRTEGEIFRN
jgi:hypothetical protein